MSRIVSKTRCRPREGGRPMPRMLWPVLLLTLFCLESPADQENALVELGTAFTGRPHVIGGDLVMESDGLHEVVRRIEDAAAPSLLGWLDHSQTGYFGEVRSRDGLVLAVHDGGQGGFQLIDLGDPAEPEVLGVTSGTPFTSGWLGDQVAILGAEQFCLVYDLTDPTAPLFTAAKIVTPRQGPRWFSRLGDRLYIVDDARSLRAFDLSDPLDPDDLGTIAVPVDRIDAMIAGDGVLHLLAARPDGLALVTVTIGADLDLAVIDDQDLAAGAGRALTRADDLLLAALDDGSVRAFDLSDPLAPVGGFALSHLADHVAISDWHVFVLEIDELHIYERTPAGEEPARLISRPRLPRLRTVIGDGPVVLAQRHATPSQLIPVDVTNPRRPHLGEAVDLGFGRHLATDQDLLVVSDGSARFDLWDIADPEAPVRRRSVRDLESRLGRGRLAGGTLVFEGLDGVSVILYDVSDPDRPVRGAGIRTLAIRAISESFLLVGGGSRLDLFEIADVHRPKRTGPVVTDGNVTAAAIDGAMAYLVVERMPGEVSLRATSLADPAAPQQIGRVDLPSTASVLVARGSRLYAQSFSHTMVVDVADPTAPRVVGDFPSWGQTGRGLAFHDDLVVNSGWLICLRDESLAAAAITPARAAVATLEPAYPNPFNPSTTIAFRTPRPGRYTVTILDARGRRVAGLLDDHLAPGRHTLAWHGRDAAGRPVASGVYLVHLAGEGVDAIRSITLLK
ncbi:hypothetical protein GF314_03265 [bacterium]|nr:hypothetical protein [bacterium]